MKIAKVLCARMPRGCLRPAPSCCLAERFQHDRCVNQRRVIISDFGGTEVAIIAYAPAVLTRRTSLPASWKNPIRNQSDMQLPGRCGWMPHDLPLSLHETPVPWPLPLAANGSSGYDAQMH